MQYFSYFNIHWLSIRHFKQSKTFSKDISTFNFSFVSLTETKYSLPAEITDRSICIYIHIHIYTPEQIWPHQKSARQINARHLTISFCIKLCGLNNLFKHLILCVYVHSAHKENLGIIINYFSNKLQLGQRYCDFQYLHMLRMLDITTINNFRKQHHPPPPNCAHAGLYLVMITASKTITHQ